MTSLTSHQRRTLSQALSRVADASVADVLRMALQTTPVCRRIGITGPPGAGKSTLIARLARERLRRSGDIAILAVDPTSPISGGTVLGDRIRMEELADHPRIFIRSMASRRSHDGLADNLPDLIEILENAGYAELILETVGVGQVEYGARGLVDTVLLVLMPGAGDLIQAMKSGIVEIADILVVNKADLSGAQQLAADLGSVLKARARTASRWTPPIVATSMSDPSSIVVLSAEIDRHQAFLNEAGDRDATIEMRRVQHVGSLVARRLSEIFEDLPRDVLRQPLAALYETVVTRLAHPLARTAKHG